MTAGKTGDLVVKPASADIIFIALGRLFRAVEFLAARSIVDAMGIIPYRIWIYTSRATLEN
jgi:hypothetical protein